MLRSVTPCRRRPGAEARGQRDRGTRLPTRAFGAVNRRERCGEALPFAGGEDRRQSALAAGRWGRRTSRSAQDSASANAESPEEAGYLGRHDGPAGNPRAPLAAQRREQTVQGQVRLVGAGADPDHLVRRGAGQRAAQRLAEEQLAGVEETAVVGGEEVPVDAVEAGGAARRPAERRHQLVRSVGQRAAVRAGHEFAERQDRRAEGRRLEAPLDRQRYQQVAGGQPPAESRGVELDVRKEDQPPHRTTSAAAGAACAARTAAITRSWSASVRPTEQGSERPRA